MANFHYEMGERVSRGSGKGVVATAAYMNREKFRDERTGVVHDYRSREPSAIGAAAAYISRSGAQSERQAPLFVGLYAPEGAPEWCRGAANVERFWNAAEKAERHPNAQIAERVIIALPHELTLEQNKWLLQDHIRDFTRQGRVVHVAIHAPEHDEKRNIHAHLLISTRGVDATGMKPFKAREQAERYLHRREYVSGLRERWAAIVNRHLERHGHASRIDHRSLKERGIEREPNIHLGPAAMAKERRGERTVLGDRHRAIQARNAERERARREIAGLEREIAAIDRAVAHKAAQVRETAQEPAAGAAAASSGPQRGRGSASDETDRYWQTMAERHRTDIPTVQEAMVDRVPSGWRALTVADVARALSPAYAKQVDAINQAKREIAIADKAAGYRERDKTDHNDQRDRRWQQLTWSRKALHRLGWRDREIKQHEKAARQADTVSDRMRTRRWARGGALGTAQRQAARELEKIRPQVEAELARQQQTAAAARALLAAPVQQSERESEKAAREPSARAPAPAADGPERGPGRLPVEEQERATERYWQMKIERGRVIATIEAAERQAAATGEAARDRVNIPTVQEVMADRVASGWRALTVADVARELSPAYAEQVKAIDRLKSEIAKADAAVDHRERDKKDHDDQRDRRSQDLTWSSKALHQLGWRDRTIDKREEAARQADSVSERMKIKRRALDGALDTAQRQAARELEKIRPQAEAELARRQKTAAAARATLAALSQQSDRESEKEVQERSHRRGHGWGG